MAETYQMFRALPSDCSAFLSRKIAEGEEGDMIEAYCQECERRHPFAPSSDD